MGKALAYLVNHWDGLCLSLDDGRVESGQQSRQNLIRLLQLSTERMHYSRATTKEPKTGHVWPRSIGTCKLNGIEPFAYMKATLEALAAGHPNADIDTAAAVEFQRAAHGGCSLTGMHPAHIFAGTAS